MSSKQSEEAPAIATHKLAQWNPFRDEKDEGGEELGEEITEESVAGGGRGTFDGDLEERKKLHISHAIQVFLKERGELNKDDVGQDDGQVSSSLHGIPPDLVRY